MPGKSKILVLTIAVALAAALVGGGTMAWFHDADTSDPVTMAAGTVLIEAGSSSIASQYFDPADGVFVYGVIGNSGDLYEIDVQNKVENKIYTNPNSYSSYYPNGLAFDDVNDRLYFAASRTALKFYDFSADTLVDAGNLAAFTAGNGDINNKDVYGATFGGGYFWYVPNGTPYLCKVAFDDDGKIADLSYVTMTNAPNLQFGDIVIAYDEGIIYGSSTSFYFTYDTNTGVFTNLGTRGRDLQLAWGHDGVLYGHNTSSRNWYTVVPDTGVPTLIFTSQNVYNDLAPGSKSYWNPGDSAWAKFNVKNVGTKNSYVRLDLSGSWMEYDEEAGAWVPWLAPADVVTLTATGGDWVEDEGYFYLKNSLALGDTAEISIKVELDGPSTTNEFQGKRFVLTGTFDAIQTTHGASDAEWGWSPGA